MDSWRSRSPPPCPCLSLWLYRACACTVVDGQVYRGVAVEVLGLGAMRITGHLSELMEAAGMNFTSMFTVRTLKEVGGSNKKTKR